MTKSGFSSMCGIFAAVSVGRPIDSEAFARGLAAVSHRGPDGNGIASIQPADGINAMLGHQRLSIFDLSKAGTQPMTDGRGRTITYNGEIFNWPELRSELEQVGYRFQTRTDTEVILAAYDKWGVDCVKRFNGFWAFVLLDEATQDGRPLVFASRDRFGIKPIYVKASDKSFVASSEIRAIFEYFGERPEIDMSELARSLILEKSHDSEATFYSGVVELEPAHNATFDPITGRYKTWRYWSLSRDNRFEGSEAQALERFSEIFEDSVRLRLRGDREVALTLSGGVDSSAIAVAASKIGTSSIRAFTSHFDDHAIDETKYAAKVANFLGFEHVLVKPDIIDLSEEEKHLTKHQELLYGGFSLLVNWAVIREIRDQGIAVFLTGQGGDELFLGYERYFTPFMFNRVKNNPFNFFKSISDITRNSRMTTKEILGFLVYFSNTSIRQRLYLREARKVLHPELCAAAETGQPYRLPLSLFELHQQEISGSQLRRLLRYDDRTAAAFGTEGRPAFLDHRLAEFAVSLDWDLKISNGWTKYLVRRYIERAGLPEIAWRTHKLGYNAPTLDWTAELFEKQGGLGNDRAAARLLKPGLTRQSIPNRTLFKVYNLLSTAREMNWAV